MNSDSKLKVSNKKQTKHKISEAYRSGQTALGRSPCQGGAATHVHRQSSLPDRPHSAGHRVREEPRHTYTGDLPCRPDCTRQVAVSGRSRDTRTQAVFPAGQTAFGRSLCQGGAATHVHSNSQQLPAFSLSSIFATNIQFLYVIGVIMYVCSYCC